MKNDKMNRGLLALLFVAVVMLAAGCDKELKLEGTVWTAHRENFQGETGMREDYTLDFVNATNGDLRLHSVLCYGGEEFPVSHQYDFAYTFDGADGVLTIHYSDANYSALADYPFHYDAEVGTLTLSFQDYTLTFAQED